MDIYLLLNIQYYQNNTGYYFSDVLLRFQHIEKCLTLVIKKS